MDIIKNNKGFTLIELLTAVSIFGILVAVIFSFYVFGMQSFISGEEKTNLLREGRLAANYIESRLRFAELDEDNIEENSKVIIYIDENLEESFNDKMLSRFNINDLSLDIDDEGVLEYTIIGEDNEYITQSSFLLYNYTYTP